MESAIAQRAEREKGRQGSNTSRDLDESQSDNNNTSAAGMPLYLQGASESTSLVERPPQAGLSNDEPRLVALPVVGESVDRDQSEIDEEVVPDSESPGSQNPPQTVDRRGGRRRVIAEGGDEYVQIERSVEAPDFEPEEAVEIENISITPIEARWSTPLQLANDALTNAVSSEVETESSDREQDEEQIARSAKALEQQKQAHGKARSAYSRLVNHARSEQASFVTRSNLLTRRMVEDYGRLSQQFKLRYENALPQVDASADRACNNVQTTANDAITSLDIASQDTSTAINQAGNEARRLINRGNRNADSSIVRVVAGLVAGHVRAYNTVIREVREALDAAKSALGDWRDNRFIEFSTRNGAILDRAKNETRQLQIPRWVEAENRNLDSRFDQKKTAWERSRDQTRCSLSCSYTDALQRENSRMVTQARRNVSRALRTARSTLSEQTQNGKQALREQRDSVIEQIRNQQRATRQNLNNNVRSNIGALHREAGNAIQGIQSATRSSLPAYSQASRQFEQSLRNTSARSNPLLSNIADKTPSVIARGLSRSTRLLGGRLQGNALRLNSRFEQHNQRYQQGSDRSIEDFDNSISDRVALTGEQMEESIGGLVQSFARLAGTVSDAATGWSRTLEQRMSAFIAQKRGEAASALSSLLSGESPAPASGAESRASEDERPAVDCSHCESEGGEQADAGGAGAQEGGPQGLTAQKQDEIDYYRERGVGNDTFETRLRDTGSRVQTRLRERAESVSSGLEGGFAGTVDEAAVVAALRGLTRIKGRALNEVIYRGGGGLLRADLRRNLRDFFGELSDDYWAAAAYLRGDNREGARLELEASVTWYNDDEARIEAAMRALSPDDLRALGQDENIVENVGEALGGTDRRVFDALLQGDHALADAYRMRDAINSARRKNDADAVHSAIEQYTGAPQQGDWRAEQEMSADDRRTAVVEALGSIVTETTDDDSQQAREALNEEQRAELRQQAVDYVTRDIEVYVGGGGQYDQGHTETRRITGANRDLTEALLLHGAESIQGRVARIGVEIQRRGDPPNVVNLDRAVFDERFTPDPPNATSEQRESNRLARIEARRDRERTLLLAAQAYGGEDTELPVLDTEEVLDQSYRPDSEQVSTARQNLIDRFGERFGDNQVGAQLAAGLLTDERPSARTASLAMQHAMYSRIGTDEELLFRFTERMTREEIAAMRAQFREDTRDRSPDGRGLSLDAELGTYGEGSFGEVSGDDRLRMERALRGVARTEQERLEAAAYALQQQRRETGSFGQWLAEGTLADEAMNRAQRELELIAGVSGGEIRFDRYGNLLTRLPNFNSRTGEYQGTEVDRDSFLATVNTAQMVADNYSRRIDAFADVATAGIAVLGAIAAAVITVVTGGAAGPLIAAAVVAGLASMAANYAIKGGRYGWEQAAIDLGMTAVQAVTAGVGAQLGAAAQLASKGAQAATQVSRTITALSRIFTNNPVLNQIIVGAITGSISGLGMAALNEQTWQGKGDPVANLFQALIKGALAGAATAAVTNGIEEIGKTGAKVSDRLQGLVAQGGVRSSARAMLLRGLGRGAIQGAGGMAGRSTEILVDAITGRYRGDAGDALMDIGQAGLHAAVQGIGEGAAESVGQRFRNQRVSAAESSINQEREILGLEPLGGDMLRSAAEDLLFLNTFGAERDGLGQFMHLEHIATHGGLMPGAADAPQFDADGRPLPADTDMDTTAVQPQPEAGDADALRLPVEAGDAARTTLADSDDQALFPNLSDAEIDAAFEAAESGQMLRSEADKMVGESRAEPDIDPEILEVMLTEIGEKRRMAARGGLVDEIMQDQPGPPGRFLRRGEEMPGRSQVPASVKRAAREQARRRFGQMLQEALNDISLHNTMTLAARDRLTPAQLEYVRINGRLPPGVEFHHLLTVADFPEFAHLAEAGSAMPVQEHREAGHAMDPTRPVETASLQDPDADVRPPGFHEDPEARKYNRAKRREIAEGTRTTGDVDRDLVLDFQNRLKLAEQDLQRARSSGDTERIQRAQDAVDTARQQIETVEGLIQASVSDVDGAAAAIPGSHMQLAESTVIHDAPVALKKATDQILGRVSSIGDAQIDPSHAGGDTAILMTAADGQALRVKVIVADTENGDIASFNRADADDDFDFIVRLSPRAPEELHAQAIAHELAEIRFHDAPDMPRVDALRSHTIPREGAGLSPHDRGRLAELEVLQQRLLAADSDASAAESIQHRIDELVAHLGLLHGDDTNPRRLLVIAELAENSAALAALEAARKRALSPQSSDVLGPAKAVVEEQRLSSHDRRRIAQLEETVSELQRLREQPPDGLSTDERLAAIHNLEFRIRTMASRMGLLDIDAASSYRLGRILEIVGPDSPAAMALTRVARETPEAGSNNALRPGLRPDESTGLSADDRARLERLERLLADLPPKPTDPDTVESQAIRQQRHEVEVLAAEMGLVHGQHAAARQQLAIANMDQGTALVSRLAEVQQAAIDNPLLLPRAGTLTDLPLLARQIEAAQALGDLALVSELTQVTGMRLAEAMAQARSSDLAERRSALAALRHVMDTDSPHHALFGDALQRHRQLLQVDQMRAEAALLERRLESMQELLLENRIAVSFDADARSAVTRKQRQAEALQARIDQLQSLAASLERVALRPSNMDAETAKRLTLDHDEFGGARRLTADPDFFGNADQQRLGRILHADSPQFQDWPTFIQLYFDLNPSLEGRFRTAGESSGEIYKESRHRHRRQQELAEAFISGKFVTPKGNLQQLSDLPLVPAVAGKPIKLTDANGQPLPLDTTARAGLRGGASMQVEDAVALRQHLIEQHQQLKQSGTADNETLKHIQRLIRDLSEALGEAAGLTFAESLPGGGQRVTVARGSGEVDILHISPEPDSVVTWIECKGGKSELGSRVTRQGGRTVRAEQTTPEYIRSIANDMIRRGFVEEGNAILQALDRGPPHIRVVVVRQPFDDADGSLQPIEVTDYPVTRKGL